MRDNSNIFHLAGDEGFEPPITGPEPVALPLGQSPTISQERNIRILNVCCLVAILLSAS